MTIAETNWRLHPQVLLADEKQMGLEPLTHEYDTTNAVEVQHLNNALWSLANRTSYVVQVSANRVRISCPKEGMRLDS